MESSKRQSSKFEIINRFEDIEIDELISIMPHRYPFLLLDKLTNIEPAKSAIGIKSVTINEPFFNGHFPSYPVMPGVLIVEAIAQTITALMLSTTNLAQNDNLIYLRSIDNAKFIRQVRPGDQLKLKVSLIVNKSRIWRFYGEALVDDKICAKAEITAIKA